MGVDSSEVRQLLSADEVRASDAVRTTRAPTPLVEMRAPQVSMKKYTMTDDLRQYVDKLAARAPQSESLISMPIGEVDALIESHAKRMASRCQHCSGLLLGKYALLEGGQLSLEIVRSEPALFTLLASVRKTPQRLSLHRAADGAALSSALEAALSAKSEWPNPLELDLVNAACSRELQLPYKDEHERLRIMELHGKAQASRPRGRTHAPRHRACAARRRRPPLSPPPAPSARRR